MKPIKKRHKFLSQIVKINDLTPTVKEYILTTPEEFDFVAGQFVTIKFQAPPPQNKIIARAYSIASSPGLKNQLELCIKLVEEGKVTPFLFSKPPKEINLMGPMGHFYLEPKHLDQEIIFIATGTGIAPFKSMIEDLLLTHNHQNSLILIAGVRYEEEELYPFIWESLEKRFPNFHYDHAISRPKNIHFKGNQGRVTDILPKHIKPDQKQVFIICGLKSMIESVQKILADHQISQDQILFEKYD